MADEVKRARNKLVAAKRAEFALKQRLEKIDFEIEVIQPAVQDFNEQAATGKIPTIRVETD